MATPIIAKRIADEVLSAGFLAARILPGASRLVRRGGSENPPSDDTDPFKDLSPLKALAAFASLFTGILILVLVSYALNVMLTLAIVEGPQAIYLPPNGDSESTNQSQEALFVNKSGERAFITSSIRGTLSHLRKEAGIYSPFRGFAAYLVMIFCFMIFYITFFSILSTSFVPPMLGRFIAGVLAMLCVSRISLAVTHIMISAPQPTSWPRRILNTPWSAALKTIPAIALYLTATQIVEQLANLCNGTFGAVDIAVVLLMILSHIVIVIPAHIIIIRIQASLLPDEVGTIVPFDKTFGQDISQTGNALNIQGAIASFNIQFIKRIAIFSVKQFAIFLSVVVLVGLWLGLAMVILHIPIPDHGLN